MTTQATKTVSILDLGAHDGYVSLWLARRLRERNVEVEITTVELMPLACKLARERYEREGFKATVIEDSAENAIVSRGLKDFDVVIAFELIEHVLSPSGLLLHAEQAVRPGGRVMISTPNGTYGLGNNPHHLRCWTLSELVDLLRHRGHIEQAIDGEDGISFVSYTPMARLRDVAIHTGGAWQRWAPWDVETKGLGGSETAARFIAEEAERFGIVPTVYGTVERTYFKGALYEIAEAFDPFERTDILLASRIPEIADMTPQTGSLRLWIHDVDCGDRLTPARAERFDRFYVLSKWHASHIMERYPFLDPARIEITRNGIAPERFLPADLVERDPRRVLYTSSPDRGLLFLLRLWPEVHKRTGAVLAHAYADVYDAIARADPMLMAHRNEIHKLSAQPGVERLGSLGQDDLARRMLGAALWIHPSWMDAYNIPFHETYCIGALEAAAAGCGLIGSNWGALAERLDEFGGVAVGKLDPEVWVDEIVTALEGDLRCSEQATAHALTQTWADPALAMLGG